MSKLIVDLEKIKAHNNYTDKLSSNLADTLISASVFDSG
jgi:hypothetical protein